MENLTFADLISAYNYCQQLEKDHAKMAEVFNKVSSAQEEGEIKNCRFYFEKRIIIQAEIRTRLSQINLPKS